MIHLTYKRLHVSHGLLDTGSLSNILVSTFTQAKATAHRHYDNSLLESRNSKLQSFYCKTARLHVMSQQ